jgi:hypothetical protein
MSTFVKLAHFVVVSTVVATKAMVDEIIAAPVDFACDYVVYQAQMYRTAYHALRGHCCANAALDGLLQGRVPSFAPASIQRINTTYQTTMAPYIAAFEEV